MAWALRPDMALLTLSEHAFGWDLHLDQFFCRDVFSASQPGRMVPPSAIFFVLTGTFLILSTFERTALKWTGQMVAILANLTAQGAILDLIFRADKGHGAAGHTAGAMFRVSIGMLLIPNRGGGFASLVSPTGGGRIIRRLVPASTLAPLAAGWICLYATDKGWLTLGGGIVMMVLVYSAALLFITMWTAHSIDAIDLRLAAIIDSSEDAISSKSFDGAILTWNPGAEHLYGYSAAEAIGQSMLTMVPAELHADLQHRLEHIRGGQLLQPYETVRLRKDGTRIDVSLALSAVRNARGEVIGCSAISRDISQRKRAEEEIREAEQGTGRAGGGATAELQESEREVRRKLESILSPEGDWSSFELRDIFDVPAVQSLLDDLCALTGIPVAIIDLRRRGADRGRLAGHLHQVPSGAL